MTLRFGVPGVIGRARRTSPRARAAAIVLTGGLLLTAAIAAAPAATSSRPAVPAARPAPDTGDPLRTPSPRFPGFGVLAVQVPAAAATPSATAPAAGPARVRIASLGVDAPVDAVGVDAATGQLAVPDDPSRVGWYRHGPGWHTATGSIVLAGHVNTREQGRGALFRLRELAPGDAVELVATGTARRLFVVAGVEQVPKGGSRIDPYFTREGGARLTLITCGGTYDERTGSYRDNIVVTALPR
ncbi:hypothetical protein CS0771_32800 [Catellatospora sp. IY07-71]|uniref:class F sortase n=1 Tax=Catellatospora sp. IY07-71 TaxID=2728827 RepID=UPI001BB3157E|nr:class F sortase [Catellatospora sp. IY07-71]BCJ73736.1 hypothetical protein CS0771_32800 [Catellatospora sp. IY07-71]